VELTKDMIEVWDKTWGGLREQRLNIELGCNDKSDDASCSFGSYEMMRGDVDSERGPETRGCNRL
jgi:hypothetical protein